MPEECPYCSAEVHSTEVAKLNNTRVSFPSIMSHLRGAIKTTPSFKINCVSCGRKFTLVKYQDLCWLIRQIKYDLNVIQLLYKREIDHHAIPSSITGVAFRKIRCEMDICFKYKEERAYLSCVKEKDGWHAISLELIGFD